MKPVEWFCGVFGACVGLLITIMIRSQFDSLADELAVLRESNDQLRRQLDHTESSAKFCERGFGKATARMHRHSWPLQSRCTANGIGS